MGIRYAPSLDPASRDGDHIRRSFLVKLSKIHDKNKRLTILRACSKVGARWVERLFWDSLKDPCEEIRDFLVRELGETGDFDLAYALTRLEEPPWFAKSAILRILGARKSGEAVPYIESALDDENVDVRRSAAFALGEIGGRDAVRMLVRLRKDPNPYVRATAEEGIEKASSLRFT